MMYKHIVFIAIIFILFIWAIILTIPKFYGYNKLKYYVLKNDSKIIDPISDNVIGLIKQGTILRSPTFYDFFDIKYKIKYKLVILPERLQLEYFEEVNCKEPIKNKYILK